MLCKLSALKLLVAMGVLSMSSPAIAQIGDASEPGEQGAARSRDARRNAALGDYVVGAGDLLDIDVYELEELSKTVRVSATGTISYPMIGIIDVAGLTKQELEAKFRQELSRNYIRDPQVTVFLREMRSGGISVLGAVTKPGSVELMVSGTVLEALSQAGGVGPGAGSKAHLVRATGGDPIVIDLKKLMEEADLSLNYPVSAGDVLYVPKARSYKVFVYGQVESSGVFEVDESDHVTVLQAVAMAGGVARRANAKKVSIIRSSEESKEQIEVNLRDIIEGKRPDIVLEDGDVVVVPKSFF